MVHIIKPSEIDQGRHLAGMGWGRKEFYGYNSMIGCRLGFIE